MLRRHFFKSPWKLVSNSGGNNNDLYIIKAYYVPGTLCLHIVSHLMLTIILSWRYYYWLYSKEEGMEAQRGSPACS